MESIKEIGAFAGLVAFLGLAVLALLSFTQGRDIRRLREWAGSAPERDAERKESTSAAAAERAEEMRRLEEAREAGAEAAELRETRRQRREAGLPELTRSERLRDASAGLAGDGSLGEPGFLSAIFVVLLVDRAAVSPTRCWRVRRRPGGKSGKGSAALRPSEIEVTVLNGTAVEGLAGSYGDMVERKGFELGAVTNSNSSFDESVVMFKQRQRPRGAPGRHGAGHRPGATDDGGNRLGRGGRAGRGVIGEDNASSAG